MAGKYDERVKVKTGGTEGKPVAFVAMPRRSVTVRGFDLEASYIRVEGFEITADKPATAVQLRASHCEILDNYIHHMMAAVNGTVGKPSADGNTRDYSAVAHNRIAYNKVYHCEYGFILGGEDWLVENNEVSRLFMYAPGNTYDDCDYSRFFGKGCIQRYNYYHGSTRQEIKTAHVDCLQTFTNNGEIAMDLLFEHNTCFDFHQMCMVESAPHIGSVRGWTLRHNIVSPNSPTMRGGWGPDIIQTIDVTIENCTISTVNWATIGLRGKESTGGLIRNNILCEAERAVVDGDRDFSAANPVIEYNLTFKTAPLADESNINGQDPLFVDPQQRNFRLTQGQPGHRGGQGRRDDRGPGVPQRVLRRSSSPGRRGRAGMGLSGRAAGESGQGVRDRPAGRDDRPAGRSLSRGPGPEKRRRDGPRHEGRGSHDQWGRPHRGLAARGGRKLVGAPGRRAEEGPSRRPAVERVQLRQSRQANHDERRRRSSPARLRDSRAGAGHRPGRQKGRED